MTELEEKLSALMNNPQLMQQITSMAQAMGAPSQEQTSGHKEVPTTDFQMPDPRLLQFITQAAGESRIDANQKALLHALSPYLSSNRVQKLERAMRAARLAGTASLFLNSGGLQLLSGR